MFRVKICGVTRVEDATGAADAGAEAIGLNFYQRSPRFVALAQARTIAESLPPNVQKVGVFVNASADCMLEVAERVGLDAIQLHGDEPPEMVARLGACRVIRAFRCRRHGFEPLLHHLERCRRHGRSPDAVLVDAYRPGAYGGTGTAADWSSVPELIRRLPDIPIILAGGLTPGNVAEAIRTARPHGVDAASGVETRPGEKDPSKVRAFVQNALAALARLGSDD